MAEYIEITSDLFSDVVATMNNHYEKFTFRNNGLEPEYQQDMENILMDITIASERGDDSIKVEESVMVGLSEMGVFEEVV